MPSVLFPTALFPSEPPSPTSSMYLQGHHVSIAHARVPVTYVWQTIVALRAFLVLSNVSSAPERCLTTTRNLDSRRSSSMDMPVTSTKLRSVSKQSSTNNSLERYTVSRHPDWPRVRSTRTWWFEVKGMYKRPMVMLIRCNGSLLSVIGRRVPNAATSP